ncbi:MAG: DUF1553 domain-containing protein, partial [Planctomycetota bacterium]
CPDAGQSMARRRQSTTPIQALNLFNSQFSIDQAQALADRVRRETSVSDFSRQIDAIFQAAFSRHARSDEVAELLPVVQETGLESLCRAVLNSNEFLFIP